MMKKMIDESDYKLPGSEPKRPPKHETPGLIEELEAMEFRPFGVEW